MTDSVVKTNPWTYEIKHLNREKLTGSFYGSIFDTKLKQANLATNRDFNAVSQRSHKNKEKTEKTKTFDLSNFFGKMVFGDKRFQNMFAFQSIFSTIDFKQENNKCKVSAGKSKGVYTFSIYLLHTNFFYSTMFHLL